MALARDAEATATFTTTATFNYSGNASAKAAVVLIHQSGTTDEISGVTYGGTNMVRAGSNSESTEAGRVYIYYLLNPPQGTQQVIITSTGSTAKRYVVGSMTCAAGAEIRVAGAGYATGTSSSVANPTWNITGLTASEAVLAYEVIHSGLQTMTTTPRSSPAWTRITSNDLGAIGNGFAYISNTPSGTTLASGWTAATADDYVGASIAFREQLVVGDQVEFVHNTRAAIGDEEQLVWNVATPSSTTLLTPSPNGHWEGDSITGASSFDYTNITIPEDQTLLVVEQGFVPTVNPTSITLDPGGANETVLTAHGSKVTSSATSTGRGTQRYYMLNPPAGTFTIRSVISGVVLQTIEVAWFSDTDSTAPLGTQVSNHATTGTSISVDTGDVPFFWGALGLRSTSAPTKGSNQTDVSTHQSSTNQQWYTSYKTAGGTFGYSWSVSDENVLNGVEIVGKTVANTAVGKEVQLIHNTRAVIGDTSQLVWNVESNAPIHKWIASDIAQSDGTQISSWTDGVGGKVLSQGTSTKKPIYKTNVLNGHPAVLFDRTASQQLINATYAAFLNSLAGFTVFIVFKTDGGPSGGNYWGNMFMGLAQADGKARLSLALDANARYEAYQQETGVTHSYVPTTPVVAANEAHIAAFAASTTAQWYVDGSATTDGTTAWTLPGSGNANIYMGAWVTTADWFGGHIAEVRIYDSKMDATQVATITNELKSYYGLDATTVGKNSQLVWNTRTYISDQAQLVYKTWAAVGDTSQLIHHTRAALSDTSQLVYNTRAAVGDTSQLMWNTVAPNTVIGDIAQLVHNTRAVTTNQVQLIHSTCAVVFDTAQLIYALRAIQGGSPTSRQYIWKTAAIAGDSSQIVWKTNALVVIHNEPFTGTNATNITISNTTLDEVGGTIQFATSPSGRVDTCARLNGTARGYAGDVPAPILSGKLFLRTYVYFDDTESAYQRFFAAEDHQGSYLSIGFNTWATGGELRLTSLTGNSGTSYTYALDTWYRLEVDIDYTAKTAQGRIYEGESTTPVNTQNVTWTTIARTNVNGQCDTIAIRRTGAGNTYFDDLAWQQGGTINPGPSGNGTTSIGDTFELAWNVLRITNGTGGSGAVRYLGVNSHPIWETSTGHTQEFSYLDAAACKAVRIDVRWDLIESTEGSRTGTYLDRIDNYMSEAESRGIKILPVITGAPTWAADVTGGNGTPPNAAHYSSYASFCAWAATRWQNSCDAIEIWNEPNLSQFWTDNGNGGCLGDYSGSPYPRTPSKYSDLLAAAYTAIKAAVPSMLVVGAGGFTAQNEDWRCSTHLANLTTYGSWEYMDVLSIHNYPMHVTQIHTELTTPNQPWYNVSDKNASIIGMVETDVLSVMTLAGYGNMPVWITETGYNTVSGSGDNSCTEAQQATKVGELATAFNSQSWPTNIERIYWYNLFDGKASQDTDPEQNWGLINMTNEDYAALSGVSPKASWSTYVSATKIISVSGTDYSESTLRYKTRTILSDASQLIHNTRAIVFDTSQLIYKTRVVQTGTSQRQLIHRTRALVGDSSQFVYNSRVIQTGASQRQLIHRTRALAGDSSQIIHNSRALVYDSSQIIYNTRGATFDSLQLIYKTRALASDTSQLIHKTRAIQTGTSQRQLIYKTRTLIYDSSVLSYNTNAFTYNTVQLVYKVLYGITLFQVGQNSTIRYNSRSVAYDISTIQYNSRETLYDSVQIIHNVHTFVSDSSSLFYNTRRVVYDSASLLHNTRTTTFDSSQIIYKTWALAHDISQLIYKTRALAGDSSQFIYKTRALAGDSSQFVYMTSAIVYDQFQFVYNVRVVQTGTSQRQLIHRTRALAGDTGQLIYKTRAVVGDNSMIVYNVLNLNLSAFGKNSQIIHNTRAITFDTSQLIYHVAYITGDLSQLVYKTRTLASDSEQIIYNTRTSLYDSLQFIYNIRTVAFDISQLIHKTRALASDSEQIRYNTRTSSYDSVQLIYKTRVTQSGVSQQILHNTRGLASNSEQLIYNSRMISSDSLMMIYRTRISIGSDSEIIYNVALSITAYEQITYNTLIYTGLSIVLLYKVLSHIPTIGYRVRIQLNGEFVEARLWVQVNGEWTTPVLHVI